MIDPQRQAIFDELLNSRKFCVHCKKRCFKNGGCEDWHVDTMKPIEFLNWLLDFCPVSSKEGGQRGRPSNGELRRWINNGSVQVNNKTVKLTDEIVFPITQLVLFPKGRNKTSIL